MESTEENCGSKSCKEKCCTGKWLRYFFTLLNLVTACQISQPVSCEWTCIVFLALTSLIERICNAPCVYYSLVRLIELRLIQCLPVSSAPQHASTALTKQPLSSEMGCRLMPQSCLDPCASGAWGGQVVYSYRSPVCCAKHSWLSLRSCPAMSQLGLCAGGTLINNSYSNLTVTF